MDPTAEKLTEDAEDIVLASLNAVDPKIDINLAVRPPRFLRPPLPPSPALSPQAPLSLAADHNLAGRCHSSRCLARR
jgi:hypothetical protein